MNTRKLNRIGRWLCRMAGPLALALALATPAWADNAVVPLESLPNKPQVTIQGNVVVDEANNPTGFYELALCVKSPRKIVGPDPATFDGTLADKVLTEEEYARVEKALADIKADGGPTTPDGVNAAAKGVTEASYTITYYPFSAVSAVVGIDPDVLTAVNWDLETVKYAAWNETAQTYAAQDGTYPRGIDTTQADGLFSSTDPAAFPAVTSATLQKPGATSVALDAEGDRSVFTAAAQADDYYEDTSSGAKALILTLSAHAPDNKPVVYTQSTPVCVVRFSYDLQRFPKGVLKVNATDSDVKNQFTGEAASTDAAGFWLGLDRETGSWVKNGKTPVTWLADTAPDLAASAANFTFSDGKAADTEAGQVVWTKLSAEDNATGTGLKTTEYYYYLGANDSGSSGSNGTVGTVDVSVNDVVTTVSDVKIPQTKGVKILAAGNTENPAAGGDYSYYENILYLNGTELRLRMVNDTTFRKPTGGKGGTTVLFYDWDDTLIGTLIVDKGDQRKTVNDYVESTMVHPDLRASQYLDGGALPAAGSANETNLQNITDSLDRDYTYRGKYNSNVDGVSGVTRPDDDSATAAWDKNDPSTPGSEYPLTNKLDYAFYRHVDTVTTVESTNTAGYLETQRYITSEPLSSNPDAQLYPYVYGWAVVEQESARNSKNWQVRRDSTELEDTWTTIGVGELAGLDPSYDLAADLKSQSVPTAAPAGGSLTTSYPAFVTAPATTPTTYSYLLEGTSGYLKMADFSDVESMLTRAGQDTIIVKAVYEPGTSLANGSNYTLLGEPAYTKWNVKVAESGGAYRVQLTMERSYNNGSVIQGTTRIRQPVIQQDTTVDYKWLSDSVKNVNNDLDNATYSVAEKKTETIYTQVDTDNGEEITFSLALSARQNRVDYVLIESYGANFVVGTQRSNTNGNVKNDISLFIPDNYNYLTSDSDSGDIYYDCDFATKEGSRGFVLYGTLGHFLEQATEYNHGEITQSSYNSAVNFETAADANLRMDVSGTQPGPMDNTILQNAFLAAAKACETHKGDPAYDCWDESLDCAKLTYHQAQWFLIEYQSNPAADILPLSSSEGSASSPTGYELPNICHYHAYCAGDTPPEPPTTWAGLMTKLHTYNNTTDSDEKKSVERDLKALDLAALESLTSLRSNSSGAKYSDAGAMIAALAAGENTLSTAGLDTSWSNMQYVLLNGAAATAADMTTAAQEGYWWYDGLTSRPSLNSLSALNTASDDYFNSVTLKDGTTYSGGFTAKLGGFKDAFDANAAAGNDKAATEWIKMTRNVVKSYENYDNVYDTDGTTIIGTNYGDKDGTGSTTKFANNGEALGYWLDFQTVARSVSLTPDHPQYWEFWQYYVLHTEAGETVDAAAIQHLVDVLNDSTTYATEYAALIAEFNGYWWKDGNKRLVVSSINTLLIAARQANAGGDDAPLKKVTLDLLENTLYLRATRTGKTFTEMGLSLDDAINKVKAAAALYNTPGDPDSGYLITNWRSLQYYLAHDAADTISNMDAEAGYYWWKNGGTGTDVDISGGSSITSRLDRMLNAVIRDQIFEDPKALLNYTDATKIYSDLALLQTYPGSSITLGTDGMPTADVTEATRKTLEFTSVDDLTSALLAFINTAQTAQGITEDYKLPTLKWWQIQYAFINGGNYIPYDTTAGSDYYNAYAQYWWYTAGTYTVVSTEPPDPEPTEKLAGFMEDWANGTLTDTGLKNKITAAGVWATTYGIYKNEAGTKVSGNVAPSKNVLLKMAQDFKADIDAGNTTVGSKAGDGTYTITATWAQIQYYFVTSYPTSGTAAKAGTIKSNTDALDLIVNTWGWTQEGSGSGNELIPKEVDLSVLPASPFGDWEESEEDLEEQILALEGLIERLQEQLAALKDQRKAQQEQTQTPAATPSSGTQSSNRPAAEPETPVEEPEAPAAEQESDHGERVEIPLGEEVQLATPSATLSYAADVHWVPLPYYFATAYSNSALGKSSGALTNSDFARVRSISMGFDPADVPDGAKAMFS